VQDLARFEELGGLEQQEEGLKYFEMASLLGTAGESFESVSCVGKMRTELVKETTTSSVFVFEKTLHSNTRPGVGLQSRRRMESLGFPSISLLVMTDLSSREGLHLGGGHRRLCPVGNKRRHR
jgi:hypothetical protein